MKKLGLFVTCAAVLATLGPPSSAQAQARGNCHDGYLALHKASKFSSKSSVLDWDYDLLRQAEKSFLFCYRGASKSEDLAQRFYGVIGFAVATRSLAELDNYISIAVYIVEARDPQRSFTNWHETALREIRKSMTAFDALSSDDISELESVNSGVREQLQSYKVASNDVKEAILRITFDSIPRKKSEMSSFFSLKQIPDYGIGQTLGMTEAELCKVKSSPVMLDKVTPKQAVDATASPEPTPTPQNLASIEVTVDADGSVSAVHIAKSSGSDVRDQDALSRASKASYTAATRLCESISGKFIGRF